SYAPSGQTAPDYKGAIGYNNGNVNGTDILVHSYHFSETHYFATVSQAYKNTLFALTGKVNDATFKGLAAGECLFLGATGSKHGDGPWAVTYNFAGSPNQTGLVVGDITGISKDGWDYFWVHYAPKDDTNAKAVVQQPTAAYVEKVYERGDFSQL